METKDSDKHTNSMVICSWLLPLIAVILGIGLTFSLGAGSFLAIPLYVILYVSGLVCTIKSWRRYRRDKASQSSAHLVAGIVINIVVLIGMALLVSIAVIVGTMVCSKSYEEIPIQSSSTKGPVQEAWSVHYSGSAKKCDSISDIAIDDMGNVYATGTTRSRSWFPISGTDHAVYTTIKYDRDGNQLWAKQYSGRRGSSVQAKALTVDHLGNVYVTGTAGTIKYNSDGKSLWSNRKSALDIGADYSGNAYVTSNKGTTKYDSTGNKLWYADGGGEFIELDSAGNIITCCNQGTFNAYKYATDGRLLWANDPNINGKTKATGIGLDDSDNVYITGYIEIDSWTSDCVTMSIDGSDGKLRWMDYYPGHSPDYSSQTETNGYTHRKSDSYYANNIAVDGSGNIWITGHQNVRLDYKHITIGYDSNGNRHTDIIGNPDRAYDTALDASGNIYVTGEIYKSGGFVLTTVKYDNKGRQLWVAQYPSGHLGKARRVTIDKSGNVYVAGCRTAGVYHPSLLEFGMDQMSEEYDTDYVLIKYIQ